MTTEIKQIIELNPEYYAERKAIKLSDAPDHFKSEIHAANSTIKEMKEIYKGQNELQ